MLPATELKPSHLNPLYSFTVVVCCRAPSRCIAVSACTRHHATKLKGVTLGVNCTLRRLTSPSSGLRPAVTRHEILLHNKAGLGNGEERANGGTPRPRTLEKCTEAFLGPDGSSLRQNATVLRILKLWCKSMGKAKSEWQPLAKIRRKQFSSAPPLYSSRVGLPAGAS